MSQNQKPEGYTTQWTKFLKPEQIKSNKSSYIFFKKRSL